MLKFFALSALLSCCALASPVQPSTPPSYDPKEDLWSLAEGKNIIKGAAILHSGSKRKICSKERVGARPRSALADYRIQVMFGSLERGRNTMERLPHSMNPTTPELPTLPPEVYAKTGRSTLCEDGLFEFSGLPDGTYYVMAPVVPAESVGQSVTLSEVDILMKAVTVRGGETVIVDLAADQ